MSKVLTPTIVKANARKIAFETLVNAMVATYGKDKVFIIGDSEIAVQVDISPTNEPIYVTYSPTVKDYCERTTKTKTIKAFDPIAEMTAYQEKCEEREKKAEITKENKQKKIEADKKRRETTRQARLEKEKEKKGGE